MDAKRLIDLGELRSTALGAHRRVQLWLPPPTARPAALEPEPLPVLLLHDGQNLFRPEESFLGTTWNLPTAMDHMSRAGHPALAVGVWNGGRRRIVEYSPPRSLGGSGAGEAHLDFLEHEVLPALAARFPITRQPEHTGLVGSSLGGLISLWGFFSRPHSFGRCAALSPSLGFGGQSLRALVPAEGPPDHARLYLDVGTREISRKRRHVWSTRSPSQHFGDLVAHFAKLLGRKGWDRGRHWVMVKDIGGRHTERDWARRLPLALRFLLAGEAPPTTVRVRPKRPRSSSR